MGFIRPEPGCQRCLQCGFQNGSTLGHRSGFRPAFCVWRVQRINLGLQRLHVNRVRVTCFHELVSPFGQGVPETLESAVRKPVLAKARLNGACKLVKPLEVRRNLRDGKGRRQGPEDPDPPERNAILACPYSAKTFGSMRSSRPIHDGTGNPRSRRKAGLKSLD